MNVPSDSVLCVGEVLWDALPAGLFLGGAPFNVASHLRQLGRPATLASRVGDDALGHEALRRIAAGGLDPALVQTDPLLPTGFVRVRVDAAGIPDYDIVEPSAWDALVADAHLLRVAGAARAVVFGSLAQRQFASREAVHAVVAASRLAVFDVNLRPPHVDPAVVEASLHAADVVKLNEDELNVLTDGSGGFWDRVERLADEFGCRVVCVTRGGAGAALWRDGFRTEHPGYTVPVADTVGAGDAFLAAFLDAFLDGRPDDEALDRACRLGAFVASRPGATPAHDAAAIAALR